MDEDRLNIDIRKFLKKVGITSQREIEKAVRAAVDGGKLAGTETLTARVRLEVDGVGLDLTVEGEIGLA
jgi:hypothetical protein